MAGEGTRLSLKVTEDRSQGVIRAAREHRLSTGFYVPSARTISRVRLIGPTLRYMVAVPLSSGSSVSPFRLALHKAIWC
ncbi:hypothetical protein HYQ46_000541 [Verticillium longisporum]|nr:hypothetical protein HYQ46_000541 [Verticillium longisporum]